NMSREFSIGAATKERAIGNKAASGAKTIPPFLPGQFAINVDVNAVVANRIGQHARGTAGRRRNTNPAIEQLMVNALRPEAVATRAWEIVCIARFTPRFAMYIPERC